MSSLEYIVPPLSTKKIESIASAVREIIGCKTPYLPIIEIIEFVVPKLISDFTFDIRSKREMKENHGQVDPFNRTLSLREDVYEGAIAGNGRDRFTAAHELGHLILHCDVTLNRSEGTPKHAYTNPEWQANSFASAILMPRPLVERCPNLRGVISSFGVSREAACVRAQKLGLSSRFQIAEGASLARRSLGESPLW